MDGGTGSIAVKGNPLNLNLTNNPTIKAVVKGDIYLNNISESDINIDTIDTISANHISFKTLGGIKGADITSGNLNNIKSGSLDLEGKYIGAEDAYLKINIDGTINIIALESIYLKSSGAFLNIGLMKAESGNIFIEGTGSINADTIIAGNGVISYKGKIRDFIAKLIEVKNGDLRLTLDQPISEEPKLCLGELRVPNNIIITFYGGTLSGLDGKEFRATAKGITINAYYDSNIIADYMEATDGDISLNINPGDAAQPGSISVNTIKASGDILIKTGAGNIDVGEAIANGSINIESNATGTGITANLLKAISDHVIVNAVNGDAIIGQIEHKTVKLPLKPKENLLAKMKHHLF
jgi:hypothetical protein